MSESTDADYWFLRKNGIDSKTILRILATAYKVKEGPVEAVNDNENNKGHLRKPKRG